MIPYEIIYSKRNGEALSGDAIRYMLQGYTAGTIADYQMSALLMAIYFRGMNSEELSAWADAMLHSGEVLDLSDIQGVKVDKHSTGGVGDKVSLSLAPLAACLGVKVPMVSGRGLGHTGGTLDKLESIPGFRVNLSNDDFRRLVRDIGCSLIGQTATIAPTDKKLYALRDVTATVDCVPLIASSIMSKKLAEGIDALVLDVKVGSGAFMRRVEDARTLAKTMQALGAQMNKKVVAYLTNMNQPLGHAVGNAVEVVEAMEMLQGRGPEDYRELTYLLTGEMLKLAGLAKDDEDARAQMEKAVQSGAALNKMREIVRHHHGDERAVSEYGLLNIAPKAAQVEASADGMIQAIDVQRIGLAAVALGAGRLQTSDVVDPRVGMYVYAKIGQRVTKGQVLAEILTHDTAKAVHAATAVRSAIRIGEPIDIENPLVLEVIR